MMITNRFNISGRWRDKIYVTLPTGIRKDIETTPWNHNLITDLGNLYVVSRFYADDASGANKAVRYMVVGTKATAAAPDDTIADITNPVYVAATGTVASSPNFNVTYLSQFTSSQLDGITAIGLINKTSSGTLVTINTFTALSTIPGTQHDVEYEIGLRPATNEVGWALTSGKTYTFEVTLTYTPSFVDEINHDTTTTGYVRKTSTTDVESNASSYYYDSATDKLYIHASDGLNPDTAGNTILVTKA